MAISVIVERAAGLDIAKASLIACVQTPTDDRGWRVQKRKFGTTTGELLKLRDWLASERVTRVGMESTGDYWKPVFYVLEEQPGLECWLLNARHMRNVPGRKTDMTDSEWICDLVAHGLVRPSFVPPPPIRRLRDLTRRRTALLAEQTREKQRMDKLLQDAGVKLSSVATDIFGTSGRAMIEALITGERDPNVLSELAVGLLRKKTPALLEALIGRFNDHHAFVAQTILNHVDLLGRRVADLDARIDSAIEPYRLEIELLQTIDGVSRRAAEVIIAEIGADMSRFPSPAHLASWAGLCPGNNKTGGKAKPASTTDGNRWLKATMGTTALAAARKKNSYANAQFHRIATRRGGKRATTAVAHSLIVAIWHILTHKVAYQDLGGDYFLHRHNTDQRPRKLVAQLNRLGYQVTIEPTIA